MKTPKQLQDEMFEKNDPAGRSWYGHRTKVDYELDGIQWNLLLLLVGPALVFIGIALIIN
jgi:hypothetical protein